MMLRTSRQVAGEEACQSLTACPLERGVAPKKPPNVRTILSTRVLIMPPEVHKKSALLPMFNVLPSRDRQEQWPLKKLTPNDLTLCLLEA